MKPLKISEEKQNQNIEIETQMISTSIYRGCQHHRCQTSMHRNQNIDVFDVDVPSLASISHKKCVCPMVSYPQPLFAAIRRYRAIQLLYRIIGTVAMKSLTSNSMKTGCVFVKMNY